MAERRPRETLGGVIAESARSALEDAKQWAVETAQAVGEKVPMIKESLAGGVDALQEAGRDIAEWAAKRHETAKGQTAKDLEALRKIGEDLASWAAGKGEVAKKRAAQDIELLQEAGQKAAKWMSETARAAKERIERTNEEVIAGFDTAPTYKRQMQQRWAEQARKDIKEGRAPAVQKAKAVPPPPAQKALPAPQPNADRSSVRGILPPRLAREVRPPLVQAVPAPPSALAYVGTGAASRPGPPGTPQKAKTAKAAAVPKPPTKQAAPAGQKAKPTRPPSKKATPVTTEMRTKDVGRFRIITRESRGEDPNAPAATLRIVQRLPQKPSPAKKEAQRPTKVWKRDRFGKWGWRDA